MSELIDKISSRYDSISSNVYFPISRKSDAEVDVFAIRGKKIDLYEVKCSFRIVKARQQLRRAKRYFRAENTYLYCGSSGLIHAVLTD